MTRVSKGINSTYPVERMLHAVDAVREGLSIRKAAAKFGVPRSTLADRMSGRIAPSARPGKAPVIPVEVEEKMVEKALSLADQGFGVSKKKMMARAGQLCKSMRFKNRFTNGVPGKAWWAGFRRRHPSLSLRKPEKLATVRSRGVNRTVVGSYFLALHDQVKALESSSIWNMDETSLSLEHSPSLVVARKGSKVVPGRTSNSRESVTVLPCVNAAGQKMPPIIIVKGKTAKSLRSYNTHEGPEGALWGFQKNAWMTDDLGISWFQDVFLKHCGPARPQLLIMDNHHSHETLGLLEAAAANNIAVMTFPPHTTHYLCPLDRTVFGPFQRTYDALCSEFMSSKTSALVNKITMPRLLNDAYKKAFSRSNIVSGFEATGICKWNPIAVPAKAFAPSEPFDTRATPARNTDEHPLQWVVDTKEAEAAVQSITEEPVKAATDAAGDKVDVSVIFSPDVVDQEGNVVGQLNLSSMILDAPEVEVSHSSDPMMPVVRGSTDELTAEDAANVLVALSGDLDSSMECMETSWSDTWNKELDSMFGIHEPSLPEERSHTTVTKTITSHRLLTSDDILKQKRQDLARKEQQMKEKEERKRKREANQVIKREKERKKKVNDKKVKQTTEN